MADGSDFATHVDARWPDLVGQRASTYVAKSDPSAISACLLTSLLRSGGARGWSQALSDMGP